jgi:hypothetical protein
MADEAATGHAPVEPGAAERLAILRRTKTVAIVESRNATVPMVIAPRMPNAAAA